MGDSETSGAALRHLLAYWRVRPRAADTLDGILRWWIPQHQASEQLVRQSLEHLVGEGIVAAVTAADGRTRYRLADPTPAALRGLVQRVQTDQS